LRPEIVFLLEELSARVLIEGIWPRLAGTHGVSPRYIVFEGKQDLERQLERKLRGYLNPSARFIVMRDQDASDCRMVKDELLTRCYGLRVDWIRVRIACRELETFYLGDLRAVELGLGLSGLGKRQNEARFRDPDELRSPARELERLTRDQYQKIAGTRCIAPHLDLESNRSRSFHQLLGAIRSAIESLIQLHAGQSDSAR
jgi:hypothetical protein